MQKKLEVYFSFRRRINAYRYIEWLLEWDQATIAPKASAKYRSEQIEVLSEELHKITSDPKYIKVVDELYENLEAIEDTDLKREIKIAYRKSQVVKKVPKKEYIHYQVILAQSTAIWAEAKEKDDFSIFAPILDEIVQYNRKFVKYLQTEELKGYSVLLDIYEEGATVQKYDEFFDTIKEELIPFVAQVTKKNKFKFNKKLTKNVYPRHEQKQFSKYLTEVFGYDLSRGYLGESLHPFTSGVISDDVRITTEYEENNFTANIFSTIHEMGHAIYDQQHDPKYNGTLLQGGSSYGIHESQSRMYENMIGRSFSFWQLHYPKLMELFPKQLKGIDVVEFYKFINQAKRSLRRTDADELTYSLHILVRYEIEKMLFERSLKVRDIPKKWRQLMQMYVGKRPLKDADGALQDIHWANGLFGYFPTYALGSAYAAQIYHAMNEEINVDSAIENNNIRLINAWLKENIHQYGNSKTPEELILNATKEPFNVHYYIDYLKRKFGD